MAIRIAVTGATGMVGGLIVRFAMSHPEIEEIVTVGRTPTGIEHRKVREIEHGDMGWIDPIGDRLEGIDVAFYCLGAYTGAVPDAAFRRITVDFPLDFAKALRAASPGATFVLLSGEGADPRGKSRAAFARYKGEAENGLMNQGFPRLHLVRPGYIHPETRRAEPNLGYRVARLLWPALRLVWPNAGIGSTDLARVMLDVGLHGAPGHDSPVLRNRDLRRLAKAMPR